MATGTERMEPSDFITDAFAQVVENFQMLGFTDTGSDLITTVQQVSDLGTADAIQVLVASVTAYVEPIQLVVKMNATNTGATTLQIGALGLKNVYKGGTTDLVAGDLVTDTYAYFVYDGSYFQLLNPIYTASTIYPAIIDVSDATKTLALSDSGTYQNCTHATGVTITIPPDSAVAFPIATEIVFERNGAGTVTFAAGSGVTINSDSGLLDIKTQYQTVAIKKKDTDIWTLFGALA